MLGNIFYEGKLVKRDINKAIKYFILASNQNSKTAQLSFGLIYLEGQYISRDINRSIHYFSLTSNQNDLHAQLIYLVKFIMKINLLKWILLNQFFIIHLQLNKIA